MEPNTKEVTIMKRIDMDVLKGFAKTLGNLMVSGAVIHAYLTRDTDTRIKSYAFAGYGDAVEAIMQSNMYSHDKGDAVKALPRDEHIEFYKAIISIATSRAYSHEKKDMIVNMCK